VHEQQETVRSEEWKWGKLRGRLAKEHQPKRAKVPQLARVGRAYLKLEPADRARHAEFVLDNIDSGASGMDRVAERLATWLNDYERRNRA
jgi:hypothetical protein